MRCFYGFFLMSGLVKFAEFIQEGKVFTGLSHDFRDENAGHYRIIGKVSAEKCFIKRDIFLNQYIASGSSFEFYDLVHQKKRISPGAHS
jgi:hypothetical protein